jgi:hypothetical protein
VFMVGSSLLISLVFWVVIMVGFLLLIPLVLCVVFMVGPYCPPKTKGMSNKEPTINTTQTTKEMGNRDPP